MTIFGYHLLYCLQTVAYKALWDPKFVLRNLALIGGILLLLADSHAESRSLFAGVPSLGLENFSCHFQLILLCFNAFINVYRRKQTKKLFTTSWKMSDSYYVRYFIKI